MGEMTSARYVTCYALLFMFGFVNNLGFFIVTTGAQNMAKHFRLSNLMPLITFTLVIFNILIVVANVRYMLHVHYLIRFTIAVTMAFIAYVLMAISSVMTAQWGFSLVLIAGILTGMSNFWSGAIMNGLLKFYPSKIVGAYASGSGLAGVGGAGIWVAYRFAGLSDLYLFLSVMPLLILYVISYVYLYKYKPAVKTAEEEALEATLAGKEEYQMNEEEKQKPAVSNKTGNAYFSFEQIKTNLKVIWFWSSNIGAVYFFEYSITQGFSDQVSKNHSGGSFFIENDFIIMQFCYQIGVLCCRSSLGFFKVRKLWIVTSLQILNFAVWWVDAMVGFLLIWVEFAWMFYVGLLGGTNFLNGNYMTLHTGKLPREYKEAAMIMNAIFEISGIIFAMIFLLILDNTLF